MTYNLVNYRPDTLILNVRGKLPDTVAARLDKLQEAAKDLEQEVSTGWTFRSHALFIRPHGDKQWRWILYCGDHYLHLDMGKGKLNGIIAKVRFSSFLLHEMGVEDALSAVYGFLAHLLGEVFVLQVSEVHLCADIAGWELSLADAQRFVCQGRAKAARLTGEGDIIRITGRRCSEFKFSQGAAHSCDIYDKTLEVKTRQKEWFHEVWKQNGWDGLGQVTRVEFRYKRECLHEMGMECPYDMLDRLAEMWAYSTKKWLRHALPDGDSNQSRWATSAVWQVVQGASGNDEATPAARPKKVELDTQRAKAGFVGYATSWAIRAVWLYEAAKAAHLVPMDDEDEDIPQGLAWEAVEEDGGGFLAWAYEQMQAYLKDHKKASFSEVMEVKAQKIAKLLAEDDKEQTA